MARVIVNGQEVTPAKKINLTDHMSPQKVKELLEQKQKEQRDAKSSGNQG